MITVRASLRWFLFFFAIKGLASPDPAVTFYVLSNPEARGDQNQVYGIRDALKAMQGKNHFTFTSLAYVDFTPQKTYKNMARRVFILSGPAGLEFVKENGAKLHRKDIVVWSGHQLFSALSEAIDRINLVMLPADAVTGEEAKELRKKTRLLLLEGVPHRILKSGLAAAQRAFEKEHGAFPRDLTKSVGVILPGDAPDAAGTPHFFSLDDARKLAKKIVDLEGRTRDYLVTNGPRTGSYNYKTKKKLELSPHRTGNVDAVTATFIAALKERKVRSVKLFDFQFSSLPSAYQPLLSLAAKGMRLHVPGESTSMVTESTDVARNIVVDVVPSMNPVHHRHLDSLFKAGRVDILLWDAGLRTAPPGHNLPTHTPAQVGAAYLLRLLQLQPWFDMR